MVLFILSPLILQKKGPPGDPLAPIDWLSPPQAIDFLELSHSLSPRIQLKTASRGHANRVTQEFHSKAKRIHLGIHDQSFLFFLYSLPSAKLVTRETV